MDATARLRHIFLPHHTNNQRARLLHPTGLVVALIIVIGVQFAIYKSSHALPQILGYASQIPASEIIRLTNVERQQRGLPALNFDPNLTAAAQKKAADMFAKDYWAHVSPIGTQPWFFITDSGYTYRYAGENLARDFTDSGSVIKAWLDSPSHRENVLNNRYQDIGVAVVDGKLQGHETTLVVQMFGTKLNAQSKPAVPKAAVSVETAQAAEPQPIAAITPIPDTQPVTLGTATKPVSSPFEITKYFALIVSILFAVVLFVDLVFINRRNIVRWTSKSFAHFIFVIVIITATAIILRGQIL